MLKVKHERTCDCVVAGFRMHKDGKGVGSLLLGLYDDDGVLHHVGVASSGMAAPLRAELLERASSRYREDALDGHPWRDWAEAAMRRRRRAGSGCRAARTGGTPTRTCRGSRCASSASPRSTYEGLMNGRFRHNARFRRWRPDKDPDDCTYAQLEAVAPTELREMFGS